MVDFLNPPMTSSVAPQDRYEVPVPAIAETKLRRRSAWS
jgi:hypothetical protein